MAQDSSNHVGTGEPLSVSSSDMGTKKATGENVNWVELACENALSEWKGAGSATLENLAKEIGTNYSTLYRWRKAGRISARGGPDGDPGSSAAAVKLWKLSGVPLARLLTGQA